MNESSEFSNLAYMGADANPLDDVLIPKNCTYQAYPSKATGNLQSTPDGLRYSQTKVSYGQPTNLAFCRSYAGPLKEIQRNAKPRMRKY